MKDHARIIFEGLLLFCFSRRTTKRRPDRRGRCEIGILNQTGNDQHEFVIKVETEPLHGGDLVTVDPQIIGMRENPLKITQSDLRKFASFHMYTGTTQQPAPASGSVIREKSFDTILDLEGDDFYRGRVKVVPGSYTKLYSTTGSFAGIGLTADAEFVRVSKNILDNVLSTFQRPQNWERLLDPDRRLLASFSRKVKTVIEITKGNQLVIKGIRKSGKQETIFNLPHPATVNARRYVIDITNHDVERSSHPKDVQEVIKNCAAFVHHSLAIKSVLTNGKAGIYKSSPRSVRPVYGLTENFDFRTSRDDRQDILLQRSDAACCIGCELSQSETIS
jgi:hypothetical protein